ncbi:MAG: amidohydrolase family protein [Oligoflexia bacterium]|nr:amidohydrolase family protein [Oligoflexia bacterium]
MDWKKIKKIDSHVHVTFRKMIGSDIKLNTPEKFLGVMKEHNIQKAVVVPINYPYYHAKKSMGENSFELLKFNNNCQARIAKFSKKLICFADIDLFGIEVKDTLQELERAIHNLKLKGIKIHPYNQGIKCNDKRIVEVMYFAKANDLPVIIHSFPQKNKKNTYSSSPKYIVELLQKVKSERVLISHMGGKDYNELRKIKCWFDFSFAGREFWYELGHEKLEKIIRNIGVERCCFSSDYASMEYKKYYEYLNKMNFSSDEITNISYENAEKFLKI